MGQHSTKCMSIQCVDDQDSREHSVSLREIQAMEFNHKQNSQQSQSNISDTFVDNSTLNNSKDVALLRKLVNENLTPVNRPHPVSEASDSPQSVLTAIS